MIDLFAATKTSPQSQQKTTLKSQKDDSFEKHLDKSLSEQRSLSRELKQAEIKEQKKTLEDIGKKIEQLKKELTKKSDTDTDSATNLEKLVPLEEILSFLQSALQELSTNSDTPPIEGTFESVDIMTWINTVTEFVDKATQELAQNGMMLDKNYFMAQKVSFLLEDIDIKQDVLTSNNNFSKQNTMLTVFADTKGAIEQSPPIQEQGLIAENKGVVEIAQEMELVEEPQKLEQHFISDPKEQETKVDTQNSDMGESSDSDTTDVNFEIKDLRTKNVKNHGTEDIPFTLENIDGEAVATEGEIANPIIDNNIQSNSKNEVMNIAQKMYTSLSSSITRVQVEALMQNIGGRISMLMQDGGNELRMKLTPPELGNMKLSFITEDSVMRGKVVVETPEAKTFFEQNINNLRESLANVGIELGSIDVELGSQKDFEEKEEMEYGVQAVRSSYTSSNTETVISRKSMTIDNLVDFTA